MNIGYQNEFDFLNYLNNKKYIETHILMQDFLKKLFPNIKEQDTIKTYKYGRFAKADIVINVNGIKKGVSIKSGSRNSVHLEKIEQFITILSKLKFNEIDKLLRYLYSDGTSNNTGNIRQSSSEYKAYHKEDIFEINKNLENIKYELINRFLIKTDINYKVQVDAFVTGNINDFIWATKEEVLNHLLRKNFESSGVHVSNLFIQTWNKNLKYNPKYEHCRNYIQVKWYSMFDDLIEIMINRNVT